jgi:hypothetical protein
MKLLDLEAALAGAKVVTGDGREVTQLRQLTGVKTDQELCGVCDGQVMSWSKQGIHCVLGELNLFMAPQTRTGWINIYPSSGNSERCSAGGVYDTEESANATAGNPGRIACIKIEWEE